MKLSIIIPLYNQEKLIIKTLNSIELREDLEIIVIDDCSTDKSVESVENWIKKKKFKNFKLIKNEINLGVGLTINKGLDIAKGEYVGILCSDDDYILPMSEIYKYLDGTDLIYYNLINNDNFRCELNEETKTIYVGATKFYRREFIGNTRRTYKRLGGDLDFYWELLRKEPTEKFTNLDLYHYNNPRKGSLMEELNKERQNCSVLILSCDKYSDIWKPFFILFNKYWKNCPYDIYIATEKKDCEYVNTLKHIGSWTSRVKESLKEITTEYVIIMCEDMFLRDFVDQKRVEECLVNFGEDTATYNFEKSYSKNGFIENGFRLRDNKEKFLLSCQVGLWNREKLIELLDCELNAWEWEEQIIDSPYKFYINTEDFIFNYGYENYKWFGICKGKWCREVIPLFKKENIEVDFNERGFAD